MEYREFELKGDINQLEYVTFRTKVQEQKPEVWTEIQDVPIELFYHILVKSSIESGWIKDVVEMNKYDEEVVWSWTENGSEYIDNLPAGNWPWKLWGRTVFLRWSDIKNLDPN